MKRMLAWFLILTMALPCLAEAEEAAATLFLEPFSPETATPEPLAPETMIPAPGAQAEADGTAVADGGLELGSSSVHYPRLTGLGDEALEAAVNELIQSRLGVTEYLNRVALLLSDPTGLTVTYDARLYGDVFTCVMEASGAVENSRPTHVWTAVNIDLTDGHAIGWDDLFSQPEEALEAIGAYLDERVAPELSAHLSAGSLAPLPEHFGLSPYGLTLFYPIGQLSTLQDEAGAVTILWSEIQEHLNLAEGDILDRVGAAENLSFPEEALAKLTEALAEGRIPGVPAAIGQPVQELTDAYGLQIDPDLYEGGRMFLPDDRAFRQVWLLTDALTERWDTSVVQGLRADRLNLLGLRTGLTTREEYLAALGDPESSLAVNEDRAINWRIVPGTSDYYTVGGYRLRLHVDEEGVLRSVFITQ